MKAPSRVSAPRAEKIFGSGTFAPSLRTSSHRSPRPTCQVLHSEFSACGHVTDVHRPEANTEYFRPFSAPEAVRGAVLASIAQELLGDRTPTTARDALELKHRFEVIAECQFGGVEFNLDLAARFEEIRTEMRTLGEWFSPRRRDLSLLNGQLTLVSRLMAVLRDHDEFDEVEVCRREMRDLQRKIWVHKNGWRAWPILPLRWYIEKLVGSTQLLFWVILGWIAFFFLAQVGYDWWWNSGSPNWLENLSEAVQHFVGGTARSAGDGDAFKLLLSVFAAIWGFLHLGILVSHIYRLVSRL